MNMKQKRVSGLCVVLLLMPVVIFADDDSQADEISISSIQRRIYRRQNAQTVRFAATNFEYGFPLLPQPTNGDESLYADKRASFGKGLVHLNSGFLDVDSFNTLVHAAQTGKPSDFNAITMGTAPVARRLVSPQAGLDYNLIGSDNWMGTLSAPPCLISACRAGEMVELYQHVLLRDLNFVDYDSNPPLVAAAVADLNALSDFRGPKVDGLVTPSTLFRIDLPGALAGPYISQFFFKQIPISENTKVTQQYFMPTASMANEFMTTFNEWLFIQRGNNPVRTTTFDGTPRYIRNIRELASYVHKDHPDFAYTCALLICLGFGASALNPANPYIGNPTQEQFVDFGASQFSALISLGCQVALTTTWYYKWIVHRTLRPEAYAFLVDQQINGIFDSGLHEDVLNAQAVNDIFVLNAANPTNGGIGTYLLPQAYPEGSPVHPSYPAGHPAIAGACVTLLKAFFKESFVIPSPVVPNAAGTALIPYVGPALTLGGELNKYAANIAIGRNMAGVHYRSDALESLLLGEQIAIKILEDCACTYNMNFTGYSFTKFDGTTVTIGAKRTVQLLPS
jgi:membrane-associated phospholipid phosphatase